MCCLVLSSTCIIISDGDIGRGAGLGPDYIGPGAGLGSDSIGLLGSFGLGHLIVLSNK